jgi:acetyltransferase-like isoleucine patch superfamily enzyme
LETKAFTKKAIEYGKRRSAGDITRKAIHFVINAFRFDLFRMIRCWYFFKNSSIRMGSDVILKGLSNNVFVGTDNDIYDRCVFLITPDAEFRMGDRVTLSYNVLIACQKRIVIGNDVMIGEYTSIRDTTHDYREKVMKGAQDISDEIIIGNNVWIGRGCLISEGSVIEDGVVVAANSVVKGRLESNGIYGGCPASFIKKRL